jgi:ABC-type uncharacterized transport system ATPase subunit
MKTKKVAKIEEVAVVVKDAPVAAKPISKAAITSAALIKAAKPAVKKAKPVAKVAAAKPVAVAKEVKEAKVPKKPKPKVVRDSFTMPQSEYLKIAEIKELCLKAGFQVKKSEVLRAGVIALCAMGEEQLKKALSGLDKIKTGRPNKQ